ncbi:hypothetical protein [Bacillus safensis]|uniref:Uncharacterized protein n=1 Tax=Bacillus safensis TaxID=561879 RepID=A0A1L6ZJB2_BACIA|nr:hypothetical protein [Bacillus safensis]APT46613.1 hypothetical protein BSA145_12615 [Bacillus safensis]
MSLFKREKVERVIESIEIVGISDEVAKDVAIALLKGEGTITDWETENWWGLTKETAKIRLSDKYTVTIEKNESY